MTAPSTASWRKLAACQGIDPEVFYPASDEDDPWRPRRSAPSARYARPASSTPWLTASAKASGAAPRSGSVVGSTGSVASRPEAPGGLAAAGADRIASRCRSPRRSPGSSDPSRAASAP